MCIRCTKVHSFLIAYLILQFCNIDVQLSLLILQVSIIYDPISTTTCSESLKLIKTKSSCNVHIKINKYLYELI